MPRKGILKKSPVSPDEPMVKSGVQVSGGPGHNEC